MLLGLFRDRGALAMSFVLPVAFFLIFAVIFAGATGEQLRLRLAIADEVGSEISQRFLAGLLLDPSLLPIESDSLAATEVRELVRSGTADVGLVVRAGAEPLDSLGGFGPPPLLIVSDPARGVAVAMLTGQIQKAYFAALPDVALGNVAALLEDQFIELDEVQREQLDEGLEELADEARDALERDALAGWGINDLVEREDVAGRSAALNHVAYYAGAVAVLFLLFSAVQGAISLIAERDTGVIERIIAGPGEVRVLVRGKFLFLLVQGYVQVGVIFVVAWLIYGVDLPGNLALWSVTTLLASAAAAGLALAIATSCRTQRQAQTVANVAILVLSALGGSMVPRFFMPQLLQDLGWITPNTWALEAYTEIFWRDGTLADLWLPWIMLAVAAVLTLWLAQRLTGRWQAT
jgi:ABC-2 type transport system permease protein